MSEDVKEKVELINQHIQSKSFDAIWVFDLESMQTVFINPGVAQRRGFSLAEARQQTIEDILTPESYQKAMEILSEALAAYKRGKDTQRSVQVDLYCKDGTTFKAQITAKLKKDSDGRIKMLGITRDLTACKCEIE